SWKRSSPPTSKPPPSQAIMALSCKPMGREQKLANTLTWPPRQNTCPRNANSWKEPAPAYEVDRAMDTITNHYRRLLESGSFMVTLSQSRTAQQKNQAENRDFCRSTMLVTIVKRAVSIR